MISNIFQKDKYVNLLVDSDSSHAVIKLKYLGDMVDGVLIDWKTLKKRDRFKIKTFD